MAKRGAEGEHPLRGADGQIAKDEGGPDRFIDPKFNASPEIMAKRKIAPLRHKGKFGGSSNWHCPTPGLSAVDAIPNPFAIPSQNQNQANPFAIPSQNQVNGSAAPGNPFPPFQPFPTFSTQQQQGQQPQQAQTFQPQQQQGQQFQQAQAPQQNQQVQQVQQNQPTQPTQQSQQSGPQPATPSKPQQPQQPSGFAQAMSLLDQVPGSAHRMPTSPDNPISKPTAPEPKPAFRFMSQSSSPPPILPGETPANILRKSQGQPPPAFTFSLNGNNPFMKSSAESTSGNATTTKPTHAFDFSGSFGQNAPRLQNTLTNPLAGSYETRRQEPFVEYDPNGALAQSLAYEERQKAEKRKREQEELRAQPLQNEQSQQTFGSQQQESQQQESPQQESQQQEPQQQEPKQQVFQQQQSQQGPQFFQNQQQLQPGQQETPQQGLGQGFGTSMAGNESEMQISPQGVSSTGKPSFFGNAPGGNQSFQTPNSNVFDQQQPQSQFTGFGKQQQPLSQFIGFGEQHQPFQTRFSGFDQQQTTAISQQGAPAFSLGQDWSQAQQFTPQFQTTGISQQNAPAFSLGQNYSQEQQFNPQFAPTSQSSQQFNPFPQQTIATTSSGSNIPLATSNSTPQDGPVFNPFGNVSSTSPSKPENAIQAPQTPSNFSGQFSGISSQASSNPFKNLPKMPSPNSSTPDSHSFEASNTPSAAWTQQGGGFQVKVKGPSNQTPNASTTSSTPAYKTATGSSTQTANMFDVESLPEDTKRVHDAQRRLRTLNIGFINTLRSLDPRTDLSDMMHAYLSQAEKIMKSQNVTQGIFPVSSTSARSAPASASAAVPAFARAASAPAENNKRTADTAFESETDAADPAKRVRSVDDSSTSQASPAAKAPVSRARKSPPPQSPQSQQKSQTSNLFQNILGKETAQQSDPAAPANPFAFIKKMPETSSAESSTSAASQAGNAFKFFSRPNGSTTSAPSTNLFTPKAAPAQSSNLFTPKATSTTDPLSSAPDSSDTSSSPSKPPTFGQSPQKADGGSSAPPTFQLKPASSSSSATPAFNPFQPSATNTASASSSGHVFSVPKFGGGAAAGAPVNFMSQFGQAAAKTAEAEKKKRKAEEFDSDEDDEEEWERQDAEKQAKKKAELEGQGRAKKLKFTASGFVFEEAAEASSLTPVVQSSEAKSSSVTPSQATPKPVATGSSLFSASNIHVNSIASNNIFGHLSTNNSEAGSKAGTDVEEDDDEDDEDSGSSDEDEERGSLINGSKSPSARDGAAKSDDETVEEVARQKAKATSSAVELPNANAGRSLFDRITPADKSAETPKSNPFSFAGAAGTTSPFGTPKSTLFNGSQTSSPGDHTWKNDSPIKFGDTKTPKFTLSGATPTKPQANGTGDSTPESRPFSNLFGSAKPNASPSLFTPKTGASPSLFSQGSTTPTGSPAKPVNWNFGAAPSKDSSFLFPPSASNLASEVTSRATTPGATSEDGSINSTADDEPSKLEEQVDLTGVNDANEEVLFEAVKARVSVRNPSGAAKPWEAKGTGPLRILKNKNGGKARIVLRMAPSGKVIVNTRLLSGVSYQHRGSSMTMFTVAEENNKFSTWCAKFQTDVLAKEFADKCEELKNEDVGETTEA